MSPQTQRVKKSLSLSQAFQYCSLEVEAPSLMSSHGTTRPLQRPSAPPSPRPSPGQTHLLPDPSTPSLPACSSTTKVTSRWWNPRRSNVSFHVRDETMLLSKIVRPKFGGRLICGASYTQENNGASFQTVPEYSSHGLWIPKCHFCPRTAHLENRIRFGASGTSLSGTITLNPRLWTTVTPTKLVTLSRPVPWRIASSSL